MILFALAALVLLSVPLSGGSLRLLAELDINCLWAAPLALALQVVIMTIAPGGNHALHAAIHVGTYGLVAVFIWANRRLPGAAVIAAGTILNTAAILANGGVMPRWATAQRLAGLAVGRGFHNSAVLANPHLLWLGDIIPVPAFAFPNVLSVGDCLLFVGMTMLLHRTCGRAAIRVAPAQAVPAGRSAAKLATELPATEHGPLLAAAVSARRGPAPQAARAAAPRPPSRRRGPTLASALCVMLLAVLATALALRSAAETRAGAP